MSKGDLTEGRNADVAAFLEKLQATPKPQGRGRRGRLLFAMDATASREPSWDRAVQVQGEMFLTAQALGGLDVQLVFFRGFDECKASRWVREPKALVDLMTKVMCRAGQTQIERVLNHALRACEDTPIDALVYVGDACEEEVDRLGHLAGKLGVRGVRAFVFQEGFDPVASRAFRHMAELTGGAHCQLSSTSPDELRDLLRAVAAYAAGGVAALEDANRRQTRKVRLLSKG
ncbi:MAG: VWA domain-containing protein [Geminicoccaceae bacterium]|nr:MAG: VWA domain-containing protein [Geminicoccaceae bacterium]